MNYDQGESAQHVTDDGETRIETWKLADGSLHRLDGPAEIITRTATETGESYVANEKYYVDGEMHREDGPAWISRNYRDGSLSYERYQQDGLFYRDDDQPAYVDYHPDGQVAKSIWYRDGKIHRDGAPAIISWFEDGTVQAESHYSMGGMTQAVVFNEAGQTEAEFHCRDNALHRDDGPARIIHLADGTMVSQEYYRNGTMHRDEGPASQEWYPGAERQLRSVEYRHDGFLHRVDGPAFASWNDDGQPAVEQYWVDGSPSARDDGAVIVYNDGEPLYREFWSGDQITRREGELPRRVELTPPAHSEEAGGSRLDVNYVGGEHQRTWHRSCLGLRSSPDICFYFDRGQPRQDIDRLLAYFPHRHELVERMHNHLHHSRTGPPDDQELIAAATIWCHRVIEQAQHIDRDDLADQIQELLDDEVFTLMPSRQVHEMSRELSMDSPVQQVGEAIGDMLHGTPESAASFAFGNGRYMLREACYQISTYYQLQRSIMTPLQVQDFGFDAWADLYRMGGSVEIDADSIYVGFPAPEGGSGLTITNPTTGVTTQLRSG